MIDEPVPTMPLMVPARRPTASTNRKAMIMTDYDGTEGDQRSRSLTRLILKPRAAASVETVQPQAPTFTAWRLAIRRCSTAAASRFSTTTVSSQSMQPSVMLCP